jgi:hypothetical protein
MTACTGTRASAYDMYIHFTWRDSQSSSSFFIDSVSERRRRTVAVALPSHHSTRLIFSRYSITLFSYFVLG